MDCRFSSFRARRVLLGLALFLFSVGASNADDARVGMVGDALLNEGAYELLGSLSDRFGPRMIGTRGHRESLDFLERELAALGVQTRRQTFEYPGWIRGEAHVRLLEPVTRPVRAAALGYVEAADPVEAELVYLDQADVEKIEPATVSGRILLLKPNVTFSQASLQVLAEHGARGALLINRVDGGQLLARAANLSGEVPPFPLFSITQEEGRWMQRMLEDGRTVRVRLETTSRHARFTGTNLIATFPGRSDERVILGGHFDSWDLGQGAMDNGLGVAQIYEVARLLQAHAPENEHTVELVWFDAEEFGLWGARHYAGEADLEPVRAMINLDMVGEPIAINAMGFDGLVPVLERFAGRLGSWSFEREVDNEPWLGSDHHPFILEGVPAITFYAPIGDDESRYYHDFADTFDKIDRTMLARASAIIALLVYDLANETEPRVDRLTPEESAELFRHAGLEERLKKAGGWPFE